MAVETRLQAVPANGNVRLWHVEGRRGICFRGLGEIESLSWSPDSRELAMGLSDERVAVCNAQTGQAVWIGVHLPGGETAVFSGAGQLLPGQESKMDVFDQHLAYVVEHLDGRMEVVKPSQFPARAAELAKQVTVPEWAKPVPTLPDGSIDLMPLVEIKRDAKPETDWTRDGKTLLAPQKDPNRQWQIPITLSGDYDLVVQAEAPSQVSGLFLLLQADGHPVESVLCAAGFVSGLQLIDGRDVLYGEPNETLVRESLVGQGQKFQLTCQVRRSQIRMLLDHREIVKWEGEFDRLSVTNNWGASALDGIFGLLAHAPYRIHELKLIPRSDEAKQSVNTFGDRAVAENLREIGTELYVRTVSDVHRVYASQPLPGGFFRVIDIIDPKCLYDTDVVSIAPYFRSLQQVERLSLGGCDISDDGLRHIAHFKSARALFLGETLVRNPLHVLAIDKTRLETLSLGGTGTGGV